MAKRKASTKKPTSGAKRSAKKAKGGAKKSRSAPTSTKQAAAKKPAAKKKAASNRKAAATTKTAKASGAKPAAQKVRTTAAKSSSTAGGANPKPATATSPPIIKRPLPEEPPIPKTRLSDKQLAEFSERLLDKRRELVGDVDNLTNEALRRSRSEASGDLSSMPIHMADIGSDNWEQEFTLGLIDNERTLLREIDDALKRIEDRTYGICLGTFKPIAIARLRAKPWAKYCIEYARLREQGRAP